MVPRNYCKKVLFRCCTVRLFFNISSTTGKNNLFRTVLLRHRLWPSFFSSTTMDKSPESKKTSPHAASFGQQERRMTRGAAVKIEKDRYLNMIIEEKRQVYRCRDKYLTLSEIPTWEKYFEKNKERLSKMWKGKPVPDMKYEIRGDLNKKISIWKGDITCLEIDAIVNAANNSLMGGGGVDGAIHAAAGSLLKEECSTLGGCDTGDAKITGGYKLPSKYVIHTVGPVGFKRPLLIDAYKSCLRVFHHDKLSSVAFPCISTGIYGYPNDDAAHVAMKIIREYLESEAGSKVERVIFCLFMPVDVGLYEQLMQVYFPCVKLKSVPSENCSNSSSLSLLEEVAGENEEKKNVALTREQVAKFEEGKTPSTTILSSESEDEVQSIESNDGNKKQKIKLVKEENESESTKFNEKRSMETEKVIESIGEGSGEKANEAGSPVKEGNNEGELIEKCSMETENETESDKGGSVEATDTGLPSKEGNKESELIEKCSMETENESDSTKGGDSAAEINDTGLSDKGDIVEPMEDSPKVESKNKRSKLDEESEQASGQGNEKTSEQGSGDEKTEVTEKEKLVTKL